MLSNETPRSAWTVSEANHTVRFLFVKYEFTVYPLLTRCQGHVSPVSSWFSHTVHYWANMLGARMGWRVAFETIKLIASNVLCTIFDINYHPNIGHRRYKHARGICISRYVGPYSYGELNCDRLHILITFIFDIYIITPLLTSTHKPVLARAPSSNTNII